MSNVTSDPAPTLIDGSVGPIHKHEYPTNELRFVRRDGEAPSLILQHKFRVDEHDRRNGESHSYDDWRDVPLVEDELATAPKFTLQALYEAEPGREGVGGQIPHHNDLTDDAGPGS